jgi:hemerythrin-like domain-containing protein
MPLANIESYAKDGAVADKADLWTYPETSDGWYRIHNTIKAEMAKFSAGIAACKSPLEAWQVEALQAYWKGHSDLTHDHHKHEDEMFTPMLKEKVNYPEKLEADHEALTKMMAGVDAAAGKLAAGGDVSALVAVFEPYRKTMEAHLKEEEEIVVPLMRAYFEPEFVGKKVEDIMKTMDKTLMGSFVHHQGSKKEFQAFQKQEGIPSFVWYLNFKPCRAKYRAAMETRIQALLTGAAPTKKLISKKDLALAMKVGETAPGKYSWKITPESAAAPATAGMAT